jgi:aminoglycoside 2'-N-acetyltransferase I
MRIEVKSASQLSTFEKARQDCVVTSSLYAFLTGTKWATADWTVMVWEDDDLVTTVHIVERTVKVAEQLVKLGGIGNVATKVEWRKRGYARSALQTAQDFLLEPLKVDFGMMIATGEMVPRYERLGWRVAAQSMWIDQPDGRTTLNFPVMILPVCTREWPEGSIDLCGLPW